MPDFSKTSPPVTPPQRRFETVSSRDNRWLKKFRAALRGGEPTADGHVGVEGARLVEEALRTCRTHGLHIQAVLVSASGERHLNRLSPLLDDAPAAHLLRTSDRLFAGVADTQTPQGIAALLRPRTTTFEDLLRGDVPLVVVLVGVQDPGNVGTVVRSAEAFGATGVVAARGTANPLAPKALRASAGSALRLPVASGAAPAILLAQLRVAGVRTFAASASAGAAPQAVDLRGPAALLIGNEGAGLPPDIERSADERLRIPLTSPVESLNAAVAASILLYEAARQRRAGS